MIDLRVRSRTSDAELESKVGKIVTSDDFNALLTGPSIVRKPDGSLLCVYLPGALAEEALRARPILSRIRGTTNNRGAASGTARVQSASKRSSSAPIASSILGSFDAYGPNQFCRLTAYTAQEIASWTELQPFFQAVARQFAEHVPDRYSAQMSYARRTNPDWLVPETPFTTITVNNTYATGVHTDKGDLDEGFSCLVGLRKGKLGGGELVFPRYRLALQLHTGDLALMDAHEHHGNTALYCKDCHDSLRAPGHSCRAGREDALFRGVPYVEPERISVVCYYRTGMAACGSLADENARRAALREDRNAAKLGLA